MTGLNKRKGVISLLCFLLLMPQVLQAAFYNDGQQVLTIIFICAIPFVVAFSFIVFVFYRQRRELLFIQKETALKHSVAMVEMKALRAQMNPHFIFNCMSAIHHYMRANDLQKADDYLIKFGNLIRMVLENSEHAHITLKEDLQMLELYIQLEKIKMVHGFDYTIETDAAIDAEQVLVPPLIVQPFVENSIWHGLNNKGAKGCISIKIMSDGNLLKYTLQDNGAEEGNIQITAGGFVKKKSLGMSLTRERLEVLNKTTGSKAHFKVSDMHDAQGKYSGRRVELYLPLVNADEE